MVQSGFLNLIDISINLFAYLMLCSAFVCVFVIRCFNCSSPRCQLSSSAGKRITILVYRSLPASTQPLHNKYLLWYLPYGYWASSGLRQRSGQDYMGGGWTKLDEHWKASRPRESKLWFKTRSLATESRATEASHTEERTPAIKTFSFVLNMEIVTTLEKST